MRLLIAVFCLEVVVLVTSWIALPGAPPLAWLRPGAPPLHRTVEAPLPGSAPYAEREPPPAPLAADEPLAADVPTTVETTSSDAAVDRAPTIEAPAARQTRQPITRLRAPSIRLDTEVVAAPLVELDRGTTWEVPAFKVGHGEHTAGAGEPGNAVLIGHLTSIDAGNVFRDLWRMRPGDLVEVAGEARTFRYVVTDVRVVPRTAVSIVQPTETPVVTLITCSGAWLPAIGDFAERLIVRADLIR